MKKDRILNAELLRAVAALGHTQMLVIGDAGLPVPKGVPCIDLAVTHGIPSFQDVLSAVASELVVEAAIYATEADEKNASMVARMSNTLSGVPLRTVPHEEFKELTRSAAAIIRTGECSPYSNVILVGGVNF